MKLFRGAAALFVCLMLLLCAAQAAPIAPERVYVRLNAPVQEPAPVRLSVYDAKAKELVSMELEEYVLYALAGEMPAGYPPAALRAQAVAARSYALWKSARFGGGGCRQCPGADVCTDSSCCMAFAAPDALPDRWGKDYEQNLERLKDAVQDTRGLVCAYEGRPIQALFHAVSGGYTEDAAAVFSQALPYLVSVESGGEEGASRYAETVTFSRSRLAKTLNAAFPGAGLAAARLEKQLKPLSRSLSGRVLEMRVGAVTATGRQLRKALGLNSTNFSLVFGTDAVRIRTLGFGHGVGLSQAGAGAMAKAGADFEEILRHYYTGVEIVPLSELEGEAALLE